MFEMNLANGADNRNLWYGTRGMLDADKHLISGAGGGPKDKIQSEIKLQGEKTDSHMKNFLECIRSRQTPRADVQAGFSHAVADIMAAQALAKGRRMRFDPDKLEII